jgi:hypothetical protein
LQLEELEINSQLETDYLLKTISEKDDQLEIFKLILHRDEHLRRYRYAK